MALFDSAGRPLESSRFLPQPSSDAGSFRGSIANWRPNRVATAQAAARERRTAQARAADLAANDWTAQSGLRAIADNAIGTGLAPKSTIPPAMLGISPDEARAIGEKMEWAFSIWSREAHARGLIHFEDLQYLGLSSILRDGEMLHLPVMLEDDNRQFSLAIQDLRPQRLCTPADLQMDLRIRDGVELNEFGRPAAYWIACPPASYVSTLADQLFSEMFARRPAFIGHRRNVFHLFRHEFEEQVRGRSQLASGVKLFRHLNDAIESELFAQVIAASFPVFIGMENGGLELPEGVRESYGIPSRGPARREMEIEPGTVIFGYPGEKPEILENKRPSGNFAPFVEIVQRALAAMLGIPYESLTKDFSKTTYSSMRAALNEAWKLYLFYRRWFSRLYCQPIWEMAIEEAYLRDFLGLAGDIAALSAPGFYEARDFWTSASWIGPAKGFIDPVKEIQATILALDNRLATYAEAWAERGGDFGDALPVMLEEEKALAALGKKRPAQWESEDEKDDE